MVAGNIMTSISNEEVARGLVSISLNLECKLILTNPFHIREVATMA